MYEWIVSNWIWILLGLGVVWFLFRRGGFGCGTGGSHGSRGEADSAGRGLGTGIEGGNRDEHAGRHAGSDRGARRHGGC
ncbi:MAG: hypothetical protein A3K12_07875 [Candidatus Rokubacteria bacterium RIFCSPLOWO2_12_FULL_71_19]|nr:MAG: hypothetical protein A2X53_06835 [Candidatus Rokubacteria bacterium GWA2_70_23]OGL13577.1 MAG: hypothetical protein A3K12_07875 [Candidatus Rokubacteria bacterium RIFCSPLOWO2_12_FULL_71_19]